VQEANDFIKEIVVKNTKVFVAIATAFLAAAGGAGAQTVLNVSGWKGGAAEPAGFPELIAKFQQENPDITVKFDYIGRNDMTTIMSSRIQSGTAPDVLMVDRILMQQWGGAGQLMELGKESLSAVIDPVKPQVKLSGKVLMQPMEVIGIGLFANHDLLKKAGVDKVPRNVAEMKAACGKLSAAGVTPMLLPAKDGWGPTMFVLNMGLTPNIQANENFVDDVIAGKQKFSENQQFQKGVLAIKELADAKCFDAKLNAGVDPWSLGMSEFQAGRVALMPQGAWSIQKVSATMNFSFNPLPTLDGNGSGMDMLGTAWAINASTKKTAAAKKWLDFWAKNANLGVFLAAEAAWSPFKNATDWAPKTAQPYAALHMKNKTVTYPKGHFSPAFFKEAQMSMNGYMVNLEQDAKTVLQRWDTAVVAK
jgi:raffinose/stachyose/melibiose transport system substrate-binding protein